MAAQSSSTLHNNWRQAIAVTAAAGLAWQAWRLRQAVQRGRKTARRITAFQARPADRNARVLVLGDSTGVGVGADDPQQSLCGLLAQEFPRAEIVNRSANGARVADAMQQAAALSHGGETFDLALLLVDGNDVLAGTSQRRIKGQARALLQQLRCIAGRTAWLGCANIGASPLFLPPLSWGLAWHTRRTMRMLAKEARSAGAVFVDFAKRGAQNPFGHRPDIYFADDSVHRSNASYRHCFKVLKRHLPLATVLCGTTPTEAADNRVEEARRQMA